MCLTSCSSVPILKRLPQGEASVPPLSLNISRQGPLSEAAIEEFEQRGWVTVPQLISHALIQKALAAVDEVIDRFAQEMLAAGRILSAYEEFPTDERLIKIRADDPDAIIVLIKRVSGNMPEAFARISEDPAILQLMRQLTGAVDVAAHVAWNLRVKMPDLPDAEVPWHQDNSYWEPWSWSKPILTAWVPLVKSTLDNGCLEFVEGSHFSGRTFAHAVPFKNTWYTVITDEGWNDMINSSGAKNEMPAVAVPSSPGDVVVFPGTTAHRSLPNSAPGTVRWSLDFRYHPVTMSGGRKGKLDWFYGVKDSLVLTNSTDSTYKPDWTAWAGVDRNKGQDNKLVGTTPDAKNFDTVMIGPWMHLWDVNHSNFHISQYLKSLHYNVTPIKQNAAPTDRKRIVSASSFLKMIRVPSLSALFDWAKDHKYDGLEISIADTKNYFKPESSTEFFIDLIKREMERTGVFVSGSVQNLNDIGIDDMAVAKMRSACAWSKVLGAEYMLLAASSHYEDDDYVRVRSMEAISFEFGMNFYLWSSSAKNNGFASMGDLSQHWDISRVLTRGTTAALSEEL